MKTDQPLLNEFPASTYEEWKAAAEKLLKGAPFDKKMLTQTPEGITLQPIYNQDVWDNLAGIDSTPGTGPFLRGANAEGYLRAPWKIAQELPLGEPSAFNRALMEALAGGQDMVNVLLDLASLAGKDPDEAQVGEVGACGLSLSCAGDLETAFKGLIPDAVSYHFQSGCSGLAVAAFFEAWLKKHDIDANKSITGGLNMDPLGQLAMASTLPCPLESLYSEMSAAAAYYCQHRPQFTAIGVSGMPYHQAGASANEEMGCILATGLAYIKALHAKGLSVDDAASQIQLTILLSGDFFMDIAKLRAARILWSRIVTELGGNPDSAKARIHGRTGLFNKTVHDPYVNMLRTTTEALSAAIGGVDSLCVGGFDEVIRVPDNFSNRIARNTQIILQEECELTAVIDPAGGSWFIESLTHELAEKSWASFQAIEKAGGMLDALTSGSIHTTLETTRSSRDKALGQRRRVLVGTNNYPNLQEKALESRPVDYEKMRSARARIVGRHRVSANTDVDAAILKKLGETADATDGQFFELACECAELGASIGEICKALRSSNEGTVTIDPLPKTRLAAPYEDMRLASANYAKQHGHGPRIFLINMGKLHRHKLRADFTRGFFETGGFEIIYPKGFESPDEAAGALKESGAQIAVLCGTDDDYAEQGADYMKAAKAAIPGLHLLLAGFPGDNEAAYRQAGMDDFIFVKSNNYETNAALLKKAGAL